MSEIASQIWLQLTFLMAWEYCFFVCSICKEKLRKIRGSKIVKWRYLSIFYRFKIASYHKYGFNKHFCWYGNFGGFFFFACSICEEKLGENSREENCQMYTFTFRFFKITDLKSASKLTTGASEGCKCLTPNLFLKKRTNFTFHYSLF